MVETKMTLFTKIQLGIAFLCAIIGCGVLWSLAWDSVDGKLSDFGDHHHAFNFNIASVLLVLLVQLAAAYTSSKYTRACHYMALGMTGYLLNGVSVANYGIDVESKSPCAVYAASNCLSIDPVSFAELNRMRSKIQRGDDDLTKEHVRVFVGGLFCWAALIIGVMIPIRRVEVTEKRRVCKIIFLITTVALGIAGLIAIFVVDDSSDSKAQYYQTVADVAASTIYISVLTVAATLSSNHAIAHFTAAYAGIQGWGMLPQMLLLASVGKQNDQNFSELAGFRIGGVLCFFSSIASFFTVSWILLAEDVGDNEREGVKSFIMNEAREV
eukprot:m.108015 g.108015  ORF g.108015 m.108015 type:complete len:326 (+) comp27839_c0_seq2:206-1183(+)